MEAAPRDRTWGIGMGAKNPKATDRTQWRGKNWLGQALTDVRTELEEEDSRQDTVEGVGEALTDVGTKEAATN